MEALFPGSYRPFPEDLERMWPEAIVAFDANVLLHIYRFSPATRDQLLDAMAKVGDRLWIPYQAAKEFHCHRESIIGEQHKAFGSITKACDTLINQVQGLSRHPSIDVARLKEATEQAVAGVKAVLVEAEKERISVAQDDLLRRLTDIIGDRIGKEPDQGWLDARYEEGRQRYTDKTPPGYMDDDKEDPEKFGDYVLWQELLDHARTTKRPVILVTDDTKDDWCLRQQGERLGPRQELIAEMRAVAGVFFHLYTADQFMRYAQHSLGVAENLEVIEEVQEVSRRELVEPDAGATTAPESIPGIPSGAATPWETATGSHVTRHPLIGDVLNQWQRAPVSDVLDAPSQALATVAGISGVFEAMQRANAETARNVFGVRDSAIEAIRRMSDDVLSASSWTLPLAKPPRQLDEPATRSDARPAHDTTAKSEQDQEDVAPDHPPRAVR